MSLMMTTRRTAGGGGETYPLPASGSTNTHPTYDGSGVVIHPSVLDMVAETGQPLSGYRWWRADTPYPNQDTTLENPSIWGSNDRINWTVPSGLTNPIDPPPGGGRTNSDTELVWDPVTSRLVCYWREYGNGQAITFPAATSPDGVTWTSQGSRMSIPSGTNANLSPTIYRAGPGDWRMWVYHNGGGAPAMFTASDPLGPWTGPTACTWSTAQGGYHGDIIKYAGHWISAHSYNSKFYTAISTDDGTTWLAGPMYTGIPGVYRCSILPSTEAGFIDVWTSAGSCYWRLPDSLWLDLLP